MNFYFCIVGKNFWPVHSLKGSFHFDEPKQTYYHVKWQPPILKYIEKSLTMDVIVYWADTFEVGEHLYEVTGFEDAKKKS